MKRSPVINYPYAKMRPISIVGKPAMSTAAARACFANPINGGPVLPTMGASLALLPKGFKGEPYRRLMAIFAVAEGSGTTTIDGKPFEWGINDVFVVPPWKRYSHNVTGGDAVLFSISDRPAQEALGIWREGN
jgi:gentisate 1,2-dioxygenase